MVSFRRCPGSEHSVGVMLDVGCSRITSWSYFYRPYFAFSSRSHLRMLATIYASRLLQLHLIPFTLPISLNSLDREGVRLLSPRDSQITSKTRYRDRWYRSRWFNWAQVAVRWGLRTILRVFPRWSVVVPSWGDRDFVAFGGLSSFWFRSRTLSVLDECHDLFMYLCDVASVSQLCTFPLYLFTWVVMMITSLAILLSMRLCL